MLKRGTNSQPIELNIVGSSTFGRYPKISSEKTYNAFISDTFLVPYAGYQIAVSSSRFGAALEGRGIFTSTKFGGVVCVFDNRVYLVKISHNQQTNRPGFTQIDQIGVISSFTGPVYITENNRPQIVISDNVNIYFYDPTLNPIFQTATRDAGSELINFVPGYISYHDTYILAAASQDRTYFGEVVNNTWRLGIVYTGQEVDGKKPGRLYFPDSAPFQYVGELQTKPDNVKAVVRFPSKGNMIFVMGSIVTEAWSNTGAQLFPYQRQNQFNIDYGCLSPSSVAYMDEIVVWLAQNEKSGPIIMYSDGGMPKKITTDGIDYLLSTLQTPQDSQGFLYRQDGHMFYHINFYSDNLSLFYDFNTDKFYHACDQNMNYFIAAEISFFGNQYYFVSKNNGNLFAFDTTFPTYEDVLQNTSTEIVTHEIPRIRTCKNIRHPTQSYFVMNDVGFTIESGETPPTLQKFVAAIDLTPQDSSFVAPKRLSPQSSKKVSKRLLTQDGKHLISSRGRSLVTQQYEVLELGSWIPILNRSQSGKHLVAQNGARLKYQQKSFVANIAKKHFVAQQTGYLETMAINEYSSPAIDLSVSYDGGASFGSEYRYVLPALGHRVNMVRWWNLGMSNDAVLQFKFWGTGRFVVTNGEVNIRT